MQPTMISRTCSQQPLQYCRGGCHNVCTHTCLLLSLLLCRNVGTLDAATIDAATATITTLAAALNAGSFDITNVGQLSALTASIGQLASALDAGGFDITNIGHLEATSVEFNNQVDAVSEAAACVAARRKWECAPSLTLLCLIGGCFPPSPG